MRHALKISLIAAALLACGEEPRATGDFAVRGEPIRARKATKLPTEVRLMTGAESARTEKRPARIVDGYRELEFELLTDFDYAWSATSGLPLDEKGEPLKRSSDPDARPASRLPAEVLALDGVKIFVTGFMQPVEFDGDGVKSFMLTNFPGGCCFGMVPRLNEWIVVTMKDDERADFVSYEPLTVWGAFESAEEWSGDVVVSLFRMRPDKVEIAEE